MSINPAKEPLLIVAHFSRQSVLLIVVLILAGPIRAQDASPPTNEPNAQADDADEDSDLKPTEIGIRFTPQMASAMSKKFISQMKPRYGLDDKQAEDIERVMQKQFVKFARENAVVGRDMIELMMATMIEHDGRFPKEEAQHFAKLANKFTPKLKEFISESSAEIGKKLTLKQKLQYTGDVGIAAARLVIFDNRMKRWEEGRIGDFANPFYDPADNDPAKADPEPINPNESSEHRKARKEVEAWISWTTNQDDQWPKYLEQAAKYYGFSESQNTAGKAILKDCLDRAKLIKTPEWRAAVVEARVIQRMSNDVGQEYSQGPWMRSLNEASKKLLQPLNDLEDEFKRRLEEIPDSVQRAKAKENIRKALAEKGVKQLPL